MRVVFNLPSRPMTANEILKEQKRLSKLIAGMLIAQNMKLCSKTKYKSEKGVIKKV